MRVHLAFMHLLRYGVLEILRVLLHYCSRLTFTFAASESAAARFTSDQPLSGHKYL